METYTTLRAFADSWMLLFLTLFFLFMRFVPMIAMFEVRTLLPEAKVKVDHGHGGGH